MKKAKEWGVIWNNHMKAYLVQTDQGWREIGNSILHLTSVTTREKLIVMSEKDDTFSTIFGFIKKNRKQWGEESRGKDVIIYDKGSEYSSSDLSIQNKKLFDVFGKTKRLSFSI
jgi:hypothetical protein